VGLIPGCRTKIPQAARCGHPPPKKKKKIPESQVNYLDNPVLFMKLLFLVEDASGSSPGGGYGNLLPYSCLEDAHGQRSLAGYSLWGHKELDMTE